MFHDRTLDDLDEAAIQALVNTSAQEGLTLDFKGKLDLDTDVQKREVAKDVSAMANAEGGRIIYGIEEKDLGGGLRGAGRVAALRDGTLGERLPDVVYGAVHPRPSFRRRHVPVQGGTVLVVEVYPSTTDLHMVSGYAEHRYYKRGAKGNIVMTEPEVRETYARITGTRASLDGTLRAAVGPELNL